MQYPLVKSSDFLDIRDGTHDSPQYVENGYPLITSKNLKKGKICFDEVNYISLKDFEQINKRSKVNKGDILFSMIGSIGNYAIVEKEPKYAIKNVALFKFNNPNLISKYFYFLLNSPFILNQIDNQKKGGTQKFVTLKILRNLSIPLPSIKTQQKIVTILDEADRIRRLNKELITKYELLTQSLFLEMFGDPVINPMGWEMNKLKNISTKIFSGNTPKGGSKVYVKEGITFFRSQNIWRNKIEFRDVAFIDQETHNKMGRSSLKNKDILMTKTGRFNTKNSSLGRAAMFLGEDDSANINGHVYLIRLKENIINEFVLFILTTNQYKEYIRSVCVGGIDKRQINKDHLEEFPIISPPIKLQQNFTKILLRIERQKQQAEEALQKSEDLFKSLLQRAFKGELVK